MQNIGHIQKKKKVTRTKYKERRASDFICSVK